MNAKNKMSPPPDPRQRGTSPGHAGNSLTNNNQNKNSSWPEGREGGSRRRILDSIRTHKPAPVEQPDDIDLDPETMDLKDRFAFHLDAVGGVARFFESREGAIAVFPESGNGSLVRNLILDHSTVPDDKEPDVTVIEARFAVAENGAVYVTDEEVPERNQLFLGHKLIALVPADRLIPTMHEAYEKVGLSEVGFGIFIAGPSATADIAQILVRGAHGPSEMEVWLVSTPLNHQ